MLSRSLWVPDEAQLHCQQCKQLFQRTMLSSGRHHCRSCGDVFCQRCSSKEATLTPEDPVRVCDACFMWTEARGVVHDTEAVETLQAGAPLARVMRKDGLFGRTSFVVKGGFASLGGDGLTVSWTPRPAASLKGAAAAGIALRIDGKHILIERGRTTEALRGGTKERDEGMVFSIIGPDSVLDLCARSVSERETWVSALKTLHFFCSLPTPEQLRKAADAEREESIGGGGDGERELGVHAERLQQRKKARSERLAKLEEQEQLLHKSQREGAERRRKLEEIKSRHGLQRATYG